MTYEKLTPTTTLEEVLAGRITNEMQVREDAAQTALQTSQTLQAESEPEEEKESGKALSVLTCFADIPQAVVPWLWHGWLVEGGFHILAGAGSTGKTTIALSFAATITTGGSNQLHRLTVCVAVEGFCSNFEKG